MLNLTWHFVDGVDLIGELAGRTDPFDTGVEIFDDPALEPTLGMRKTVRRIAAIEVAFMEGLSHRSTLDLSLHVAWRVTPSE